MIASADGCSQGILLMKRFLSESELDRIYSARFEGKAAYRAKVWKVLALFFGQWFPRTGTILDLGAGYCEFINHAVAHAKYAMDMNPAVHKQAAKDVGVLQQNCSDPWPVTDGQLDAVFTSNFLEHLPDKAAVTAALSEAYRCLAPGGRFIAMGPNIKYAPGAYWDFFDHYVELTELSLSEALSNCGFHIEKQVAKFLPYTMSRGPEYPTFLLRLYLAVPPLWRMFGKQFLVVAQKPA
jgi:SAM-dependent methyltransferase